MIERLRKRLLTLPLLSALRPRSFSSEHYWEKRYAAGRGSGRGSCGDNAVLKADYLNAFVERLGIDSVIEFGCGDGNQLALARYPRYLGFDVSESAVRACRDRFAGDASKEFRLLGEYYRETAALTLSLDVIYHLVEDPVFEAHMAVLFAASSRYVIIFARDTDFNSWFSGAHVKQRKFSRWIAVNASGWREVETRRGRYADFHVYSKADQTYA